ncbi:MAG TPA: hypothetical protein VNQ48_00810 [Microbacteriaceae bacterium]|nr:hypothetical protein [Microbacteriaceae bacterium]
MTEHVILLVGAASSGKSTAIATLFGTAGAGTGASAAESARAAGAPEVEVPGQAIDFGQLELAPGEMVRVYAVPASGRYDYMWQILKRRAFGVLALVRASDAAPLAELESVIDEFAELQLRGGLLVGITHVDEVTQVDQSAYQAALAARFPGAVTPVLTVDPRDRGQLITALSVLAASVESRQQFED